MDRKYFKVVWFIFLVAMLAVFSCYEPKKGPQKMKVLVENLDGNLWKFNLINVPGRNISMGNLPTGLYEKAKQLGKHKIPVGMVLIGSPNSLFDSRKTREYQKVHPRDILWKEKLEPGVERVWLFLEQGTKPDPKFIAIIN